MSFSLKGQGACLRGVLEFGMGKYFMVLQTWLNVYTTSWGKTAWVYFFLPVGGEFGRWPAVGSTLTPCPPHTLTGGVSPWQIEPRRKGPCWWWPPPPYRRHGPHHWGVKFCLRGAQFMQLQHSSAHTEPIQAQVWASLGAWHAVGWQARNPVTLLITDKARCPRVPCPLCQLQGPGWEQELRHWAAFQDHLLPHLRSVSGDQGLALNTHQCPGIVPPCITGIPFTREENQLESKPAFLGALGWLRPWSQGLGIQPPRQALHRVWSLLQIPSLSLHRRTIIIKNSELVFPISCVRPFANNAHFFF